MDPDDIDTSKPLWLFGYGSLIYKPPPHYDQRLSGYVEGYVRRFWQASEDHRGTPESPGRVVTLIERRVWEESGDNYHPAPERVWGVAYRIPALHVVDTRDYLTVREINGYSVHFTDFHPRDVDAAAHAREQREGTSSPNESQSQSQRDGTLRCLVYVGLPDNPQFVGVEEPGKLAAHIVQSHGPSGPNVDYLLNLDEALREIGQETGQGDSEYAEQIFDIDEHVHDLAERARRLQEKDN